MQKVVTVVFVVESEDHVDGLMNEISQNVSSSYGTPWIHCEVGDPTPDQQQAIREIESDRW